MNAERISWLALGFGLLLMVLLVASGALQGEQLKLPLLTLLMSSELGFVLTLIGAVQAARSLSAAGVRLTVLMVAAGCAALSLAFAWIGLSLWQGMGGG